MSVTDRMDKLAQEHDAQRVSCILAEHPRHRGTVTQDTLITYEREVRRGPIRSMLHIQQEPANGSYTLMLRDVARLGRVDLYTDQMVPCKLRDLFEADGVTRAVVLSLGHDRIHLQRYLLIEWTGPTVSILDRYRHEIAIDLRLEMAGGKP